MAYEDLNRNDTTMNLAPGRKSESVWERPGWDGTEERRAALPRVLAGIGGAILITRGLGRPTWSGRFCVSLGASLAWWALTGGGRVGQVQRWVGGVSERASFRRPDAIQEASDESFPASDAPSWTPTVGTSI